MDIGAILETIVKAASVVESLVAVGKNVAPAIKVITDLATGAQTGTVTDAELEATEATLDRMIADFNKPMD